MSLGAPHDTGCECARCVGRRAQAVTRAAPPTAEGIVSWCRGDRNDKFIVDGVQTMLNRYGETCGFAEQFREMAGRLREYCEWRHLGLGGENVDELVLARARELETMLARMRGMLHAVSEDGERAKIMDAEAIKLMPQLEPKKLATSKTDGR